MAALLSMGPELASKLDLPVGLAFGTAYATFLPLSFSGLNLPSTVIAVFASFYVLGLVTMLPGLGYGSKVLWGAIGVAAYAAYLLVGIVIVITQAFYFWSIILIPASIMVAGGIRWVSLKILLSVAADAASRKARPESERHFANAP